MKSALSLLLAASVLACPFVCHAGHLATRPSDQPIAGCCCHRTNTTPAGKQSPGAPSPSQRSGGCCQGVCGGAVVSNSAPHNPSLDTTWSLPVVQLEPTLLSGLQENQSNRYCRAQWPDDGKNRGRALCCLYSTLLC